MMRMLDDVGNCDGERKNAGWIGIGFVNQKGDGVMNGSSRGVIKSRIAQTKCGEGRE